MKDLKVYTLDYLTLILISVIIFLMYDGIVYNISHHIYTKGTKSVYSIELVLFLLLTTIFYFQKSKTKFIKYIFPVIPVISLYVLFDFFYSFLLRSPTSSDFDNLLNIYDFYPIMFFGFILFIFSILILISVSLSKIKKYYTSKNIH